MCLNLVWEVDVSVSTYEKEGQAEQNTAFDHTLKKALGCRISGNSIVANNLSAGNAFWVAVTYVKK